MTDELLVSGEAFKAMLKGVDPTTKITKLSADIKATASASKKDDLVKKIKYLDGLRKSGLSASEAYVIHNLPVIPPVMRPATVMGGNRIEFADINQLYKDHMVINNSLKDGVDILPPELLTKEREDAYAGIKAIAGLGDAISPSAKSRGVKGLLRQVAGQGGPKTGLFHAKVLSKKQDFSGRATIYAEPNLGFNEIAVPTDMIWTMYKFHILRDLAKKGYDYVNSEKAFQERSTPAIQSFNKVIKEVPIIVNRAPTLQKSNISAMMPVPIGGSTLGMNPIHLPMYAADLDGDAVSVYVPYSPGAVKEARDKLLVQHQIHDYRKGLNQSMVGPAHEAILGSMHLTEGDSKQKTVEFETEQHALEALKAGVIKENTPIRIKGS